MCARDRDGLGGAGQADTAGGERQQGNDQSVAGEVQQQQVVATAAAEELDDPAPNRRDIPIDHQFYIEVADRRVAEDGGQLPRVGHWGAQFTERMVVAGVGDDQGAAGADVHISGLLALRRHRNLYLVVRPAADLDSAQRDGDAAAQLPP